MANIITGKVGIKVSVIVNSVLLLIMVCGTYYLVVSLSDSLEKELLDRGSIQSLLGAKMVGKVLEEAIDSDMLSLADVFDVDYQQIGNFTPPKYHTKYDFYLDKAILDLEDEFLEDSSNVFAVAVDINGYLPTHNTRYQKAITGDVEKDKVGNRTKRIFDDKVGLQAAQNTQKGFLQVYNRDTGEVMWDVSSPVYVKGKHWGGFRIGVSLVVINEAKKKLVINLLKIMAVILVVSVLLTFFIVNRALAPVKVLAARADDIAGGNNLDEQVLRTSNDEIGELQSSIERLRMSMLIALKRRKKG